MTVFVIDLPLLLENGGEMILFTCYVNGTKVKGNDSKHVYIVAGDGTVNKLQLAKQALYIRIHYPDLNHRDIKHYPQALCVISTFPVTYLMPSATTYLCYSWTG